METPSEADLRGEHENTEDLNDLASKVGTLSLNAAGAEPHYLGSSSTFAFARLIKPILSRIERTNSTYTDDCITDSTAPSTCALPDPRTAIILSNAYFDNIHTQYPFLHEPDFRAWEAAVVCQGNSGWFEEQADLTPLFFLNMVGIPGESISVTDTLRCTP